MREKACLVCGKQDEDSGVRRRVETESYWYREVLKQVLDDNHDEFRPMTSNHWREMCTYELRKQLQYEKHSYLRRKFKGIW